MSVLPNEILIHILQYVEPLHLWQSCSRVNKQWRAVSLSDKVWREQNHLGNTYRYGRNCGNLLAEFGPEKTPQGLVAVTRDFAQEWRRRQKNDRRIRRIVGEMAKERRKIYDLLNELCTIDETQASLQETFDQLQILHTEATDWLNQKLGIIEELDSKESVKGRSRPIANPVALRYLSTKVFHYVRQKEAIRVLYDGDACLISKMLAIPAMCPGFEEIDRGYERHRTRLAAKMRRLDEARGKPFEDCNEGEKLFALFSALTSLYKAVPQQSYYEPQNSFIHCAFKNRKSIPLTLSVILCASAKDWGVDVMPINAPNHFLAGYKFKTKCTNVADKGSYQKGELIFLDVFANKLMRAGSCLTTLYEQGANPSELKQMMTTSMTDILNRICANIHVQVQAYQQNLEALSIGVCSEVMEYVFLYQNLNAEIAMIDADPAQIVSTEARWAQRLNLAAAEPTLDLPDLIDRVEASDLHIDETEIIGVRRMLDVARLGPLRPQDIKYRTLASAETYDVSKVARHKIGMMFEHKRYQYIGVIFGYDHSCSMSEEWIEQMDVDRLKHGRKQPFYNSLVLNSGRDKDARYVAEENIVPLVYDDYHDDGLMNQCFLRMMMRYEEAGKWFTDVELVNDLWRYVPSEHMFDEYPDDR